MLRTAQLDMAETVTTSDIDAYIHDAAWAIRSMYHTVLKASPGLIVFKYASFVLDCMYSKAKDD
jgi:hypothetical protein